MKLPPQPKESDGDVSACRLYRLLHLEMQQTNLRARVSDMRKNLEGCVQELTGLRTSTDYLADNIRMGCLESIDTNTKNLEEQQKISDRANSSLEIMQVMLIMNVMCCCR